MFLRFLRQIKTERPQGGTYHDWSAKQSSIQTSVRICTSVAATGQNDENHPQGSLRHNGTMSGPSASRGNQEGRGVREAEDD